jgi:hypothetical protein
MLAPEHNKTVAEPAKSNRRRQYIVHPKVQWKHALMLGAGVFLFCVILSCGLFASLHDEARRRVINPAAFTGSVLTVIISAAVTYSALTAGVVTFWMIVMTHRMCGPVYVLERNFQELAEGRLPKLRPLRSKDEFKDVFETFSKAIDRLRQDKERQLEAMGKALAELGNESCEQGYGQDMNSAAAQLRQMQVELVKALGQPTPGEKTARPRASMGAA